MIPDSHRLHIPPPFHLRNTLPEKQETLRKGLDCKRLTGHQYCDTRAPLVRV